LGREFWLLIFRDIEYTPQPRIANPRANWQAEQECRSATASPANKALWASPPADNQVRRNHAGKSLLKGPKSLRLAPDFPWRAGCLPELAWLQSTINTAGKPA
jgi:hypothetical protein